MSANSSSSSKKGRPRLGVGRRRAVSVSSESLIRNEPLFADGALPLLVEPAEGGVQLEEWVAAHRDFVAERLADHGGILFRGFGVSEASRLEAFLSALSALAGGALEYKERSSPRHSVRGNIYTSTDYPPEYPIFLHNENSYQQVWPLNIAFACSIAADAGGETPVADVRRVEKRIDPEVRDRFARQGWMYQRNYGDGFGLPWQTVFGTDDRAQVEEHCARSGIEVEWRGEGRLSTRAVRPALARHPRSGEVLWFNHATFFHVSTLEPAVRESLLREFSEDELPTNTYYGDGSPIEPEVLDHLREAYEAETVRFPWQVGDLLLLDNMRVAHGRSAFQGERQVLAGMAEAVHRKEARVESPEVAS